MKNANNVTSLLPELSFYEELLSRKCGQDYRSIPLEIFGVSILVIAQKKEMTLIRRLIWVVFLLWV